MKQAYPVTQLGTHSFGAAHTCRQLARLRGSPAATSRSKRVGTLVSTWPLQNAGCATIASATGRSHDASSRRS